MQQRQGYNAMLAFDPDAPKKAANTYRILTSYIKDFEASLDDDHEVCLLLASFGQSVNLAVTEIGFKNPDILVFRGYVGGLYSTIIQHQTQLNFLAVAQEKEDPKKPPRRIGFEQE